MNNPLLDSIITLTSQQDGTSLEACLIMTLPQLFTCSQASLYICKLRAGTLQSALLRLGVNYTSEKPASSRKTNVQIEQPDNELSLAAITLQISMHTAGFETSIWVPHKLNDTEVVCIKVTAPAISDENKAVLIAITKIYANYELLIRRSERDKLTGLLNRSSLEQRYRIFINEHQSVDTRAAEIQDTSLYEPWLAMLDIDNFKDINSRFGHLYADEVLLRLSQMMQDFFLSTDLLFRYGGEEFLIVLKPVTQSAARKKFEDFVKYVSSREFPLVGSVTISIGFTRASGDEFFQKVVERADKALSFVKSNGRNHVHQYELLVEQNAIEDNTNDSSGEIDLF